jgi:hypothetical protein
MMEAARTSETLVNFYQTIGCYNPLTAVRTSNPTQERVMIFLELEIVCGKI